MYCDLKCLSILMAIDPVLLHILKVFHRKLKKVKHATIGSSKPKPAFLLTEAQPKLDAIEQIRADLNAENIEVPGIVVAGAQSAGKSSLLESLSNVNLPSGENITTRVPLILRLVLDHLLDCLHHFQTRILRNLLHSMIRILR